MSMELLLTIGALGLIAAWTDSVFQKPKPKDPPKTPEQEFGEAVGKYISKKGAKIKILEIEADQ